MGKVEYNGGQSINIVMVKVEYRDGQSINIVMVKVEYGNWQSYKRTKNTIIKKRQNFCQFFVKPNSN